METRALWLVQYSPSRGVFHIGPAEDCLGVNRAELTPIEGKPHVSIFVKDFMAVGIASSWDEARTIAHRLEELAEKTGWPNFRPWKDRRGEWVDGDGTDDQMDNQGAETRA
jgi:hypothetical protein